MINQIISSGEINIQACVSEEPFSLKIRSTLAESGVQADCYTSITDAMSNWKSNNYSGALSAQDENNTENMSYLQEVKRLQPKTFRMILLLKPNLEWAVKAVNQGLANHIFTGWTDLRTLPEVLRKLQKTAPELEEIPQIESESLQGLKKIDDTLRNSLKARTQSFLNKRMKLEAVNLELQSNLFETIKALFSYLEKKNQWIGRHSKMTAALSSQLAQALDLPQKTVEAIEIAALLHDIGKIGIPDKIISKSSHLLTRQQIELAAKHVNIGRELLEPVFALENIGTMILHHHENYDGTGMPDKLAGEAIPLGSRIIAVTDTFVNLTEKIHTKVKISQEKAFKELESKGGTLLDPYLVEKFIESVQSSKNRPQTVMLETLLSIEELQPGMLLARDIFSTRGTNVLRKGQVLAQQHIDYLKEYDRLEKIFSEIFVYLDKDSAF